MPPPKEGAVKYPGRDSLQTSSTSIEQLTLKFSLSGWATDNFGTWFKFQQMIEQSPPLPLWIICQEVAAPSRLPESGCTLSMISYYCLQHGVIGSDNMTRQRTHCCIYHALGHIE